MLRKPGGVSGSMWPISATTIPRDVCVTDKGRATLKESFEEE